LKCEGQSPENKANETPTVYLRKRRVYLHIVRIHSFGGQEFLAVSLGGLAVFKCGDLDRKYVVNVRRD